VNGRVLFEEALVPRTPEGDDVGDVVLAGEVAAAGAFVDEWLTVFFGVDECEAPRTPFEDDGVVALVLLFVEELLVVELFVVLLFVVELLVVELFVTDVFDWVSDDELVLLVVQTPLTIV